MDQEALSQALLRVLAWPPKQRAEVAYEVAKELARDAGEPLSDVVWALATLPDPTRQRPEPEPEEDEAPKHQAQLSLL
jgi:hypothetical protein